MNPYLRKGLLLGLGIAAASKEKVEKYVNDLTVKGEIAPQEAKELLNSLLSKGESVEQRYTEDFRSDVKENIQELGFVTIEQYRDLEKRVRELEAKHMEYNETKQDSMKSAEDLSPDDFNQ